MKRFKSILLICDEESLHNAVIRRATSLAKANGASVTLIEVVDSAPGEFSKLFSGLSRDLESELMEFHRKRLARVARKLRAESIETDEAVLKGVPFLEIIRKVLTDGHDLVMKGAGSGQDSLFFTSTDLHLMRKCPCPVWVMKKTRKRHYARVLAAVEPDATDEQRKAMNKMIMELATSLTIMDGGELHVVNAWKLDDEQTLRHSGFAKISEAAIDTLLEKKRLKSEQDLNRLVLRHPSDGVKRHVHLLKGHARDVIPKFAAKQRVELIVMGTVGRTGIPGVIIGNTAEAILNQVECSVIAVKPPGFETPVLPGITRTVQTLQFA